MLWFEHVPPKADLGNLIQPNLRGEQDMKALSEWVHYYGTEFLIKRQIQLANSFVLPLLPSCFPPSIAQQKSPCHMMPDSVPSVLGLPASRSMSNKLLLVPYYLWSGILSQHHKMDSDTYSFQDVAIPRISLFHKESCFFFLENDIRN